MIKELTTLTAIGTLIIAIAAAAYDAVNSESYLTNTCNKLGALIISSNSTDLTLSSLTSSLYTSVSTEVYKLSTAGQCSIGIALAVPAALSMLTKVTPVFLSYFICSFRTVNSWYVWRWRKTSD